MPRVTKQQIIDELEINIQNLNNENKELRYSVQKLNDEIQNLILEFQSIHNSRGAGRKAKHNTIQVEGMKDCRDRGWTYKEISNKYNCSIGLVYKLINEK